MEQKIGTVIDLVKRSVKGNFTAQELLHLKEGVPYDSPTMFNPEQSPDKLIDDMCDLAYFAAASNKLQLNHCEQMARVGLCYARYAYNCLHDKIPKKGSIFNGQDVAEETLKIIEDMCATMDMLVDVQKMEVDRRKKEGDSGSESGRRDSGSDNDDDHENKSEEDDTEEDEEDDAKEEELRKEEENRGKDDVDEPKPNTLSHHINRKCVVTKGCSGYYGPNLKRHLRNVHVRKGQIHEEHVATYFAMGHKPKKRRGPPRLTKGGKKMKGRWKRWCPEEGCNYLGCYLPDFSHLAINAIALP